MQLSQQPADLLTLCSANRTGGGEMARMGEVRSVQFYCPSATSSIWGFDIARAAEQYKMS